MNKRGVFRTGRKEDNKQAPAPHFFSPHIKTTQQSQSPVKIQKVTKEHYSVSKYNLGALTVRSMKYLVLTPFLPRILHVNPLSHQKEKDPSPLTLSKPLTTAENPPSQQTTYILSAPKIIDTPRLMRLPPPPPRPSSPHLPQHSAAHWSNQYETMADPSHARPLPSRPPAP